MVIRPKISQRRSAKAVRQADQLRRRALLATTPMLAQELLNVHASENSGNEKIPELTSEDLEAMLAARSVTKPKS